MEEKVHTFDNQLSSQRPRERNKCVRKENVELRHLKDSNVLDSPLSFRCR